MDGFHYYKSELDTMEHPAEAHRRRGAPFTYVSWGVPVSFECKPHARSFNAEKLMRCLASAKADGCGRCAQSP
jgi:hypothetical protein